MTSRSAFKFVSDTEIERATRLANKHNFDAIPIVCRGTIKRYWDQEAGEVISITNKHRVQHDASVEEILPRLNEHLVQFVYYRSEVVGLIDLSDLNKPLGRLPWLHSILECEHYIVTKAHAKFNDDEIFVALGKQAQKSIRRRRSRAQRDDLVIPLLAFANFSDVLNAAARLGIVQIDRTEIALFVELRNRLAHAGRNLIEKRKTSGKKLLDVLKICRRILANA